MIRPSYRLSENGTPMFSKSYLNAIAEKVLRDYDPGILEGPAAVQMEPFIQNYLRSDLDFLYLSNNGIYLGETVFNDTDKLTYYEPRTGKAEYASEKAGTIVIDRGLLQKGQETRYRFTLAHEAGHRFLHSSYFYSDQYKRRLSDVEAEYPIIRCRMDLGESGYRKNVSEWTANDTLEWQANMFASAILMPQRMVKVVWDDVKKRGYDEAHIPYYAAEAMAARFNVSYQAACLRLKDLKFVMKNDLSGIRSVDKKKADRSAALGILY